VSSIKDEDRAGIGTVEEQPLAPILSREVPSEDVGRSAGAETVLRHP